MIKVSDKIEEIIKADHEALFCLSRGVLNLSSYARGIHGQIEESTKKDVRLSTIIMGLSRLRKKMGGTTPLLRDVPVDGITIKTPLAEVVFEKSSLIISRLSVIQKNIKPKSDEWFSFSQNSKATIVICSESRIDAVKKSMGVKPLLVLKDLTALGLSINEKFHAEPNITFSLLHKIAEREIPLAEIFTTRDEMMFLFETKYLSEIVKIFDKKYYSNS